MWSHRETAGEEEERPRAGAGAGARGSGRRRGLGAPTSAHGHRQEAVPAARQAGTPRSRGQDCRSSQQEQSLVGPDRISQLKQGVQGDKDGQEASASRPRQGGGGDRQGRSWGPLPSPPSPPSPSWDRGGGGAAPRALRTETASGHPERALWGVGAGQVGLQRHRQARGQGGAQWDRQPRLVTSAGRPNTHTRTPPRPLPPEAIHGPGTPASGEQAGLQ